MALSRVKVWISERLNSADLNAEFNNILNNALSLISPLTGNFDINNNQLQNAPALYSTGNIAFRIDSDNNETGKTFTWEHNAGTELMRLNDSGVFLLATTETTGSAAGYMILKNTAALQFINAAGTTSANFGISGTSNDDLVIGVPTATDAIGFLFAGTSLGQMKAQNGGMALRFQTESSADHDAPAANECVIYIKDTGGGKTTLAARFATGAVQTIATEP